VLKSKTVSWSIIFVNSIESTTFVKEILTELSVKTSSQRLKPDFYQRAKKTLTDRLTLDFILPPHAN
jgi:hypothetical protein